MGVTLWLADYRYARPAPQPAGWQGVPLGAVVDLPSELFDGLEGPLLIHCLAPDCPCSRFVLARASEVAERFQRESTSVVLMLDPSAADLDGLHGRQRILDPDGAIAAACGLYSTPTAALLDGERRLLFAGNYTTTRYCADPDEQPLESVLRVLSEEGSEEALALSQSLERSPFGCPLTVEGSVTP